MVIHEEQGQTNLRALSRVLFSALITFQQYGVEKKEQAQGLHIILKPFPNLVYQSGLIYFSYCLAITVENQGHSPVFFQEKL